LFTKILVPIDGSPLAEKAANFAGMLSEKHNSDLVLLSVAQDIPILTYEPQGYIFSREVTFNYIEEMKKRHNKILVKTLEKLQKRHQKLNISTILLQGNPVDKIIEIAQKKKADLIVMGSHGLGVIKKFFLGSISDRVADQSSIPILLVK